MGNKIKEMVGVAGLQRNHRITPSSADTSYEIIGEFSFSSRLTGIQSDQRRAADVHVCPLPFCGMAWSASALISAVTTTIRTQHQGLTSEANRG